MLNLICMNSHDMTVIAYFYKPFIGVDSPPAATPVLLSLTKEHLRKNTVRRTTHLKKLNYILKSSRGGLGTTTIDFTTCMRAAKKIRGQRYQPKRNHHCHLFLSRKLVNVGNVGVGYFP
jgi:hypothetical protein